MHTPLAESSPIFVDVRLKRAKSIEALIKKSRAALVQLKTDYERSLHEKTIREEMRVDIKNVLENLRSCLDYMAQDLHEGYCAAHKKPRALYFPVRQSAPDFAGVMAADYPDLQQSCKAAYDYLESLQPFSDPWLGKFNRLNNENKHQNLTEQTRTESKTVTVSAPGGGSVSWGPGVTFGHGVSVMGVPIDPRTQMPVPNQVVETKVVTWIDFKFSDISESAYAFLEISVNRIEGIFNELQKHC